jgi:hypothetical protein
LSRQEGKNDSDARDGNMNIDWRQFYRKAGEPPIQLGDMIRGMSKDKKGQWAEILAQVSAVELLTTKSDGGCIYRVKLAGC